MIKQVTKMNEFVGCNVFDIPFMSTEFTRKMFHRLYIVIVLLKILMLIVNKEKKTPRELEVCDIPSILEYDAFIFFSIPQPDQRFIAWVSATKCELFLGIFRQ